MYAPRTVVHSETVLRRFYDFHHYWGTGPIINPFPLVQERMESRPNAHHNPMRLFRRERVRLYRPRIPKRVPRAIPNERFNKLFAALGSHRDRAGIFPPDAPPTIWKQRIQIKTTTTTIDPATGETITVRPHVKSRMGQRPRERLPVLPALVRIVEQRRREATERLQAAWAGAIVEVLRHTGIRAEELLELTHHSFIQYRLPTTGELVPLLQIAPSKTDAERLLLISPELADVLSAIICRVRDPETGVIPSVPHTSPKSSCPASTASSPPLTT